MRYKLVISDCKLLKVSDHNDAQKNKTQVFFLDVYLDNKNLLTGDYFTSDENGNVDFDTSFEIKTNLISSYFEFKVFSTQWQDVLQRDFLSKKNVDELIQFSDTESNDNFFDAQTTSMKLNSRHHNQNLNNIKSNLVCSEPSTFAKQQIKNFQSVRFEQKEDQKSDDENNPFQLGSWEIVKEKDSELKHEDIKLEFDDNQSRESSSLSLQKNMKPTTLLDTNLRSSNLITLVKSPIKEENEEEESSKQETPSQSLKRINNDFTFDGGTIKSKKKDSAQESNKQPSNF